MLLEDRKAQLFPTLTPRQRAFAIRFASASAKRFEAGEKVFDVGDRNAGVWLIAEGGIVVHPTRSAFAGCWHGIAIRIPWSTPRVRRVKLSSSGWAYIRKICRS